MKNKNIYLFIAWAIVSFVFVFGVLTLVHIMDWINSNLI